MLCVPVNDLGGDGSWRPECPNRLQGGRIRTSCPHRRLLFDPLTHPMYSGCLQPATPTDPPEGRALDRRSALRAGTGRSARRLDADLVLRRPAEALQPRPGEAAQLRRRRPPHGGVRHRRAVRGGQRHGPAQEMRWKVDRTTGEHMWDADVPLPSGSDGASFVPILRSVRVDVRRLPRPAGRRPGARRPIPQERRQPARIRPRRGLLPRSPPLDAVTGNEHTARPGPSLRRCGGTGRPPRRRRR
jgi:hypothetical protein